MSKRGQIASMRTKQKCYIYVLQNMLKSASFGFGVRVLNTASEVFSKKANKRAAQHALDNCLLMREELIDSCISAVGRNKLHLFKTRKFQLVIIQGLIHLIESLISNTNPEKSIEYLTGYWEYLNSYYKRANEYTTRDFNFYRLSKYSPLNFEFTPSC